MEVGRCVQQDWSYHLIIMSWQTNVENQVWIDKTHLWIHNNTCGVNKPTDNKTQLFE